MTKPIGAICNLDCEYCYYLKKLALYPTGSPRMSHELLDMYVKQLLESQAGPEVEIAWQGGEPTVIGLPFFEEAMAAVERHRRPGQRVTHALQTNGTLLNDAWGEFFAAHDVLVGISLDGPAELHDRYRHDKRGRPTAERVLKGLEVLRRHNVEHNILCTVNAANADHPLDVYRYFRDDLGETFIQFIPIVEHEPLPLRPEAVTDRSVRPDQWGEFLCAVFDDWLMHDVGRVFVQEFDAALAAWVGAQPGICVFAETCGLGLAMEHNGDVYSCDHFVDPEHRLGNIHDVHLVELVSSEQQIQFGLAKRDTLPRQCRECDVRFACWGECPRNRFLTTPDGEQGLNYLCEGYKSFFHHVDGPMHLMAGLLEDNRPPSDVMTIFARAPRNAPCPCGSGRKAKHCHGR